MSPVAARPGHSAEWLSAYRAAAPEDTAQRDLVAQLALPIRADETREQARRVAALRAQITLVRPPVARRLHARLTGRSDPLGRLFRLTLHPVTVTSLLQELDAKRRGTDQVLPPWGTDGPHVTPIPPGRTDRRKGTDVRPPKRPVPPPHKPQPPVVRTPVVPPATPWVPPWKPPGMVRLPPDPPTGWARGALSAGASALGSVLSVGLRAVSAPAMEKALEAAWLVFQVTEAEPAALIGMAGEAAAEAFLADVLGLDPGALVNLNTVEVDFPVIDLIGSTIVGSVKVRGVLSTLPATALVKQVRSAYTSDLLAIITGEKKVEQAARLLLDHRGQLGRAWPRDLRATTVEGVSRYLREKTVLLVPADHVQPLRRTLGEDLYRRLSTRKQALDRLGITSERQLARYVSSQADRIVSMGPTSTDFRVMAETAAKHLPPDVTEKWRKKYAALLRQAKRRAGG